MSAESHPHHPERATIESDPAYDYNEDQEVDEAWAEEGEVADDDERIVPLDEAEEEFRGDGDES
ncbi:hypothetical protein ACIPWF_12865 [Paenarthrobacter sp. NPDC089989]|uniref:hypothetical protein n=1 Tax=unclassified Paenarthrobacter TaxID=2634190 RepID=UPI0038305B05